MGKGAGGLDPKKMPGGFVGGQMRPVPDDSEEGRAIGETEAHLRCKGCGVRLTRDGFEFVMVQVLKTPLSPDRITAVSRVVACAGIDGCEFAAVAAQDATAVRPIKAWQFMDDPRLQAMFNRADQS